jgi:hypothetical protein
LLRGIYNNRFNELSKKKEYQSLIENLWNFCYERIRKDIWLKRCEEVIRLEKIRGIEGKDKKKRVRVEEHNKNKKNKVEKTEEKIKNSKNIEKIY